MSWPSYPPPEALEDAAFAQRACEDRQIGGEQLWLFEGGEMPAPVLLAVVHQVVPLLRPCARGLQDLLRILRETRWYVDTSGPCTERTRACVGGFVPSVTLPAAATKAASSASETPAMAGSRRCRTRNRHSPTGGGDSVATDAVGTPGP